jgi:hypothetical protein
MKSKPYINLVGRRFGRLVVTSLQGKSGRYWYWNCQCDCGQTRAIPGAALRNENSKSCGCLRLETLNRPRTHGGKSGGIMKRAYRAWRAAKNRCYYSGNAAYKHYGERGIIMCDRWKNDYAAFLEDMGEPEDQTLELDRIDPNGNYEPGNCRWATRAEQLRNFSKNVFVFHNGNRMCLKDYCALMDVSYGAVNHRRKAGQTPEDAVQSLVAKKLASIVRVDGPQLTH